MLLTSAVLLFLNLYAPTMIRRVASTSQRSAILSKAQSIVSSFSGVRVLDRDTVSEVIQSVRDVRIARLLVTDAGAKCLYDSMDESSSLNRLVLYPELAEALRGYDAVHIRYEPDQIVSKAGVPIAVGGEILGAVYLLDRDPDQALLIAGLQRTIFWISIGLETVIVLFSALYSVLYSRRMSELFLTIRRLHGGDYSVRLPERGRNELVELGKAFNALARRLDQSEQVRKQFVSNASHELKTPLASIKLLTDSILQNDMDPATMREFVSDIGSEADRLTRLSAKLLELTRLDTQPVEERELVAVEPVADRMLRMLTPLARRQEIRLELEVPARCAVLATSDDLYQILFNLVENGIKYNFPGGSVLVRGTMDAEKVLISVEDSGMGIPEAEKAHIFERFYRVDKARSRASGGSGLGLSIVHDAVLAHGGTIAVGQNKPQGSVFIVTFPRPTSEETGI